MTRLSGKALYAYVAGILDGEGDISIIRHKRPNATVYHWELIVAVSNTKWWLPQFLKMQFGGYLDFKEHQGNCKPSCRWTITAHQASVFLERILPYLQLKKQHAELAIAFQQRRGKIGAHLTSGQRVLDEADYIVMKTWNKRGMEVKDESFVR